MRYAVGYFRLPCAGRIVDTNRKSLYEPFTAIALCIITPLCLAQFQKILRTFVSTDKEHTFVDELLQRTGFWMPIRYDGS